MCCAFVLCCLILFCFFSRFFCEGNRYWYLFSKFFAVPHTCPSPLGDHSAVALTRVPNFAVAVMLDALFVMTRFSLNCVEIDRRGGGGHHVGLTQL